MFSQMEDVMEVPFNVFDIQREPQGKDRDRGKMVASREPQCAAHEHWRAQRAHFYTQEQSKGQDHEQSR